MAATPPLTVITCTYNWPSVLELAIRSALGQTFGDFEYLIVGDACTDETETMVRDIGDPRIVWHNLEHNCGNQSGPNQYGLERARGKRIAYLNHDDLWFPDHLAVLNQAMDRQDCGFASSFCVEIAPPGDPYRGVLGLPGRVGTAVEVEPMTTTVMHTAQAGRQAGGWSDWRTLHHVPTQEFFQRCRATAGQSTVAPCVTALKFHSADRPGSYVKRTADEQRQYADLMRRDPQLRHHLLAMALVSVTMRYPRPGASRFPPPPAGAPAGWQINEYRKARGLPPIVSADGAAAAPDDAVEQA
jgi:glycosyltransferase involved in cell wall biosynthesis